MIHPLLYPLIIQRWLSAPMWMLGSLIVLVIIGAIIIFIAGVFLFFLPAIIVSGVVWWLTKSEFIAGIAFLLVSLLSLVKKK